MEYSPEAEEDLAEALEFIARENQVAAYDLADRIMNVGDRLAAGDFDGPETQLTSRETVRSWPVSPFRIYYQRRPDMLWIIRIYHQSRRPITK